MRWINMLSKMPINLEKVRRKILIRRYLEPE